MCSIATSSGLSAVKGKWPVSISYKITPAEYRSLCSVALADEMACSGAMYNGDPKISPRVPASTNSARSKSVRMARPSAY
jgi:hypothetical protein